MFSSDNVRIQYGQTLYDSIQDAEGFIEIAEFVTESNLEQNGLLRGFLIVESDTTALDNSERVLFVAAGRKGLAEQTPTGQSVYRDNILIPL